MLQLQTIPVRTVALLREAGIGDIPAALVLGSGLTLETPFVCEAQIAYGDIPGFPTTSVQGHKGRLSRWAHPTAGKLLVMEGRPHLYEGWTMDEVAFPVRLLHAIGVTTYLVTNAAGGLHPDYRVGEFIALSDHISMLPADLTIPSGADAALWESRRGLSPYDQALVSAIADRWPSDLGPLRQGVYVAVLGPNYETPAEVKLFRRLGGDLIGMSTATEAAVAASLGMRVVGLSLVSNSLAGTSTAPLTHLDVLDAGKVAARHLSQALDACAGIVLRG